MKAANKLNIIFEDDNMLAVNKPAGMLSIPDRKQSEPSLKDILLHKYENIFTVHRLDRETSGLIIFAKNETTHKYLCGLFTDRKIEKIYVGIVKGKPRINNGSILGAIGENPARKGMMNVHRNGKPSHTDYEVLVAHDSYSLLKFILHTGRTHQIRVHSKEIGHPLACDELYGDGKPVLLSTVIKKYNLSKNEEEERPLISRVALHSYQLNFTNINGEEIKLEASIPKEFLVLMKQLNKK